MENEVDFKTSDSVVRSEAKLKIGNEISNLNTSESREILIKKIREEIADSKGKARESLEKATKFANEGIRVPDEDIKVEKTSLQLLSKISEASKRGLLISKTAEGNTLLIGLADRDLSSPVANTIVACISDYLLGEKKIEISRRDQTDSSFIRDYKIMLEANIEAAEIIEDLLRNAIRQGKLSSNLDIERIEELVLDKKDKDKVNKKTNEEIAQEQSKNYNEEIARRDPQIRREKERELKTLREKFNKAIDAHIRKNSQGAQGLNELSSQEIDDLRNILIGAPTSGLTNIEESVRKLGLNSEDLAEIGGLQDFLYKLNPEAVGGMFLTDPYLKGLLGDAIESFKIKEEILDPTKGYTARNKEGQLVFTKDGKIKFSKLINKYYFEALKNIHQNSSEFFDQAIQQGQYQYYLQGLQGTITNTCEILKRDFFSSDDETQSFLTDRSGRFQSNILSLARVFHDLPLYARDSGSFEKWPEFLGRLFPSSLAEAFVDDPVMQIMRSEATMYLKKRLVLNKNRMPSDLFSGDYKEENVRYSFTDQDKMRDNVKKRVEALRRMGVNGLDKIIEPWEYEKAKVYALGIGIATLIDPEIIATANPNTEADFKGIYMMAANLSAKHNWGMGRGYPASSHIPELLTFDVELFPEEKGIFGKIFKKKRWVPDEIHNRVKDAKRHYGDLVTNEFLDRDGEYQELLNMINIFPSLNSRAGWRTEPARDDLFKDKDTGHIFKEAKMEWSGRHRWSEQQWDTFFKTAIKKYGTSAAWWWESAKLDVDIDNFLEKKFNGNYKSIEMFKKCESNITLIIDGKPVKVTFPTLKAMHDYQLRGEFLHRYLNRNPGDVFLLINQLNTELLDTSMFEDNIGMYLSWDDFKTKLDSRLKEKESKGDFKSKHEKKLEYEKAVNKYRRLIKRWGGEENFKMLGKLRRWVFESATSEEFARLIGFDSPSKFKEFEKDVKINEKIKKFVEYFTDQSGTAFEAMRLNGKTELSEGDIKDGFFKKILFDNSGLYKILETGEDSKIASNRGFWTFLGQTWTLKEGNINPFATDLNYYEVFKRIGRVGEDVMKRWLGDAALTKKMIDQVSHIDEHLMKIATTPGEINFEEIIKIHENVYNTLRNIIGEEYAHRANYILASIVGKFFWEDSLTRNTFINVLGLKVPTTLLLGRKLSLSRLVTGNNYAHTLDTNAIRTYFMKLGTQYEFLAHEGPYSYQQLNKTFDASTGTYVSSEMMPNVGWYIVLFLLYSYLKKGLEDIEGKQK